MKNHKNPLKHDLQRSLFGEILDWLLAPLLFIWPISIAVTHYFANTVASYPYDLALKEDVQAIARQIQFDNNSKPTLKLTAPIRALNGTDEADTIYLQVVDRDGHLIAGDSSLLFPQALSIISSAKPSEVHYLDFELAGKEIRIGYMVHLGHTSNEKVLIELGETLNKRGKLSNKILTSVILPQFVIIPLAVVLVWFGLSQGLRSLNRLQEKIEARRQGDLSPISKDRVPEELLPLIDAFNAMIERMTANIEAQQRFIADAAHQLRTPLAGLKTQAQLVMHEENPEALYHSLIQISRSVDRASHMVNQLLSLARIESVRQPQTEFEEINLKQLLCQVAENLIPLALSKEIDLGVNCQETIFVKGNSTLLQEMISNLIDNAIRYTPPGGHVTCHLYQRNMRAIIDIVDSGIGIDIKDSERAFERFYRADGNLTHGSGLGLPIVRQIAEQHNGGARLLPNRTGKGCTARVVLPYSPDTAQNKSVSNKSLPRQID